MDSSSFHLVTDEEFKIFHSIDRDIFTRLVYGVGRDPDESMQVMAFWLWLERSRYCKSLIYKLLSWPLDMLNHLANESFMCLNLIQTDSLLVTDVYDDLILLQSLAEIKIDLHHFYTNRIHVFRGVTKIINEVCIRAFTDIIIHGPNIPNFCHQIDGIPIYHNVTPRAQNMVMYDIEDRKQINDELDELLNDIVNVIIGGQDSEEVPPDERTIFLTFSKGYPVSENEVRDFFTRKYGNFIENVYMQEVGVDEQALYARVVARSVSMMDVIVEKGGKSKYTINGKHVWARKYVKKVNSKSPPR